ncbi:hypothetical protein [Shewanella algidipiscicola]|uniref:50S ribosomal protein L33 n=1 Tax=Shewanella algidipiscicola TaxID=614070 RepID=A0ABQ4PDW7_9GAMM|nr:hypothetical protein [Shewanella algidipiscicola]GIU45775.1 hypothetical protein TUM4630_14640 [Shewanella algidipiscicola]
MNNKKSKEKSSTSSSSAKVYQLNDNGEFRLNLADRNSRKRIMSKISRFKGFPVTA